MNRLVKETVGYQVLRSLWYCLRYMGKDVYPIKAKKVNDEKKVHIVARGPSINESLKNIDDSNEFYMLNGLATSDYLVKYKPSTFFLFDPAFFDACMTESAQSIWNGLNERITWEMELVVPYRYKKSARNRLGNQKIKLRFARDAVMMTESYRTDFFFYKKNLAIPPVGTVAMYAIYWAIQSGVKTIYVHGVDYSFRYETDRENRIWYVCTHENGIIDRVEKKKFEGGKLWQAYEMMVNDLKACKRLNMYAEGRGIKIINMSPFSHIDAFEKNEMNEDI